MRVIVAGSRHITDYALVSSIISNIIKQNKIPITELVCGKAKGVDTLGELWANSVGIPIKLFPARWERSFSPRSDYSN